MALRRIHHWLVAPAAAGAALLGLDAPTHAAADGCTAGISSDFNGDGRTDAVVGDPTATVNGLVGAGRIVILYGDADGLVGEGSRAVRYQGLDFVSGVAEAGDGFGAALATADLNCDEYTDVVVGVPNEDINGQADSGYVHLLYGGPGGLAASKDARILTQITFNRPIVAGDHFGYAVDALEDVGQGGAPEPDAFAVAVGVPGGDVDGKNDAGWAGFLVATDGGNVSMTADQDTPGVAGDAEAGDAFGTSVSLNQLVGGAGELLVDAAVGAPREDVGAHADAGGVTILRDLYDEITAGSSITQDSPGVPGAAETGDRFGATVDTVRAVGTTRLAVGAPREDVGSGTDAGAVQFFSSNGTTMSTGVSLTQNTSGVSGAAEDGDFFGSALAWSAPGLGSSVSRLGVGTPGEDTTANNAGTVQVFPSNNLGAETTWTQASASVPGNVEAADGFGSSVSAVSGPSERVLLVGVPDDVTYSTGMVEVLPFTGGTPRAWIPGVGGIPTGGTSAFGRALASAGT